MKYKGNGCNLSLINLMTEQNKRVTPFMRILKELIEDNEDFMEIEVLIDEMDIFIAAEIFESNHDYDIILLHTNEYNGYTNTYNPLIEDTIKTINENIKEEFGDTEWYKNEWDDQFADDVPFSIYIEPLDSHMTTAVVLQKIDFVFKEYVEQLLKTFVMPKYKETDIIKKVSQYVDDVFLTDIHVVIISVFLTRVFTSGTDLIVEEIEEISPNHKNYWHYVNIYSIIAKYAEQYTDRNNFDLFVHIYECVKANRYILDKGDDSDESQV